MTKVCQITSSHDRYDQRIFQKVASSLFAYGFDSYLLVIDNLPDEVKSGVHIISAKKKFTKRIPHYLWSWKTLKKKALGIDAQLYQLHDPELLFLGLFLKKHNKTVVFDSHEDYPNEITEKRWIPVLLRPIFKFFYSLFEKKCFRRFDGLITVNDIILKRIQKTNRNSVVITNFPIYEERPIRKDQFSNAVCFAGNLGDRYSIKEMIEAVGQQSGKIRFLLLNRASGTDISVFKSLKGWEFVDYQERLSKEKVFDVYQRSLCGLAICYYFPGDKANLGTMGSTKLFEYMMAGLPVICTDFVSWKTIIEKNKCGICVSPNSVDEISKAIAFLFENQTLAREMGENGRRAIKSLYNWKTQEVILFDFYKNILNRQ